MTSAVAPRLRELTTVLLAPFFALLAAAPACASPTPSVRSRQEASEAEPGGLRALLERYSTDARALRSFYDIEPSPTRFERLERFDATWRERLARLDATDLDVDGRIDAVLLAHELEHDHTERMRRAADIAAVRAWLPRYEEIVALEEARWQLEPVDAEQAAGLLSAFAEELEAQLEAVLGDDEAPDSRLLTPTRALRIERILDSLEDALERWYDHHAPFVPAFAWWVEGPRDDAVEALDAFAKHLREEIAGQKDEDDDPLVGEPIGREALIAGLAREFIPYTPEELITIGESQFAWCETELAQASAELGHGADWKAALEQVKALSVPPGEQGALVADQAHEMIAFLEERELVTIPDLCKETWRVEMLSRESQRFLPFAAYGGQKVLVAYPTGDMDHASKEMALRGNNRHFTRCVTPHELIPGHHLQGFMAQRHRTYRRPFSTPFYGEGWALYWEMVEWDLGWPRGPEDRIGMLFWRMHRAARIIVSLRFHLGWMTPDEMIAFLVERVGHEKDGATSEVRRYIAGNYGPLYQCAYMLGGLQLYALRQELVVNGSLSERVFHDTILQQNSIPIELVRAALRGDELALDHSASWRFAGSVTPARGPGPDAQQAPDDQADEDVEDGR